MSFLSANWGWFLLGTVVFGCIALPFAVHGFVRQVRTMPNALGQMMNGMNQSLESDTGGDDLDKIMTGAFTGFARGTATFFGSGIKNMALASIFGLMSILSFIAAAIGFIGWLMKF